MKGVTFMLVMNERRIRDEKIEQLKHGCSAYAESEELIRLMKRGIDRTNLNIHLDYTDTGCLFIPIDNLKN